MAHLRTDNRALWLWLFNDGGAWTADDLVRERGRGAALAAADMAQRGLLEKLEPIAGSARLRYAVTGTCLVPQGLHVAEVQGEELFPTTAAPAPARWKWPKASPHTHLLPRAQ